MAHGTCPTHMEDSGNQAGCLGCSELDVSTKAQGDGPGPLNGKRQAWQSHKGCIWHKALLKKSPSHQGKRDKEEMGGRLERATVDAVLEKGSSFSQIQSSAAPTVRFLDIALHVMEEGTGRKKYQQP